MKKRAKKAVLIAILIASFMPLYMSRADFTPPAAAAPIISQASGTTTPAAVAVSSPQFIVKTLKAWITAYSSTPDQTKSYGSPFITANGTRVHNGVIATNVLPFGTKVKIPALFGDKIFTVEDRMAARKKNVFDIWMYSREAALDFGAHYAEVVVVASGPSPISLTPTFPDTVNL